MIQIIKMTERIQNLPESLLCVLLMLAVGSIFGLFDVFISAGKPVFNTMKLVSLIVTAATYRFLFQELTDKDKMIGAAIIRLLYKLVIYHFEALFGEKLLRCFKRDKKQAIVIEFYDSVQEREASYIKRPLYVFQKFMVQQEVDFFFAVVSLYLNSGARTWLNTPDLKFGMQVEYMFYLSVVLVEFGAHLILGIMFVWIINKILKERAKHITINLGAEFLKVMKQKRWVIIGFKCLLLYILLFVFFNKV